MNDLREQMRTCLQGRVCLMGLGNVDYGDDGFGVRLAEGLIAAGVADVIVAGTSPDRWIGRLADPGFDHIVFLDAVEFGGKAGSVVLLDSGEMAARFPQVSTHKISLGVLARWAEVNGTTKAWLLGVQPESLKPGRQLGSTLQKTLDILSELWRDLERCKTAEGPPRVESVREVSAC